MFDKRKGSAGSSEEEKLDIHQQLISQSKRYNITTVQEARKLKNIENHEKQAILKDLRKELKHGKD